MIKDVKETQNNNIVENHVGIFASASKSNLLDIVEDRL